MFADTCCMFVCMALFLPVGAFLSLCVRRVEQQRNAQEIAMIDTAMKEMSELTQIVVADCSMGESCKINDN